MIRSISKAGLAASAVVICGLGTVVAAKADDVTVIRHHRDANGNDYVTRRTYQDQNGNGDVTRRTYQDQNGRVYRHVNIPADRGIRVIVDRKTIDFQGPGPIMEGDRVMVPVRGVFEQMDGYVNWNADDQSVHGSRPGGHRFRIAIGSNTAFVNGQQQTLDTPPELRDGTTYVPLRFASEALGASVRWHPDTNTVSITTRTDVPE